MPSRSMTVIVEASGMEPRAALETLAAWAQAHGMAAELGSYSDRESCLDAPDAFVDSSSRR